MGTTTPKPPPRIVVSASAVPYPRRRIRVSVWAASHYVTATNIATAKNIVDDMSILKTITNDTQDPMNAIMDPTVWGPPATKKQFFDNIIAACHSNNIQCLAGVDLAEKTAISSRFNQWVHSKPSDAEIDRYAQSIVDRLNDPFRESGLSLNRPFDGISFDVEYITGSTSESLASGVTLAMFYRSVAAKLKVGTGNDTRVLGVAGGGLVDPTHWSFQPPGSGNITPSQIARPSPFKVSNSLKSLSRPEGASPRLGSHNQTSRFSGLRSASVGNDLPLRLFQDTASSDAVSRKQW